MSRAANPKTQETTALEVRTRDEAEAAMAIIAALTVQLDAEVTDQNLRLLAAHSNDQKIQDLKGRLDRYHGALALWAADNKVEFGESKTLELRQGWLRLRKSQRMVALLEGWTEELVLARLRRLKLFKGYVRVEESINRQGILNDSKEGPGRLLDDTDLERVGLAVVQTERVLIEPKLEEVQSPKAKVQSLVA